MGSYRDVAIGRMVAAGHLAGPDYLGAGVFVTPRIGEARLASESLYGISDDIRSDEELRMMVRVNAENGVRAVKTRATERAGLPDTDPRKQVFSEAQLRAIVEEGRRARHSGALPRARRRGRPRRGSRRSREHRARHLPDPGDASVDGGTGHRARPHLHHPRRPRRAGRGLRPPGADPAGRLHGAPHGADDADGAGTRRSADHRERHQLRPGEREPHRGGSRELREGRAEPHRGDPGGRPSTARNCSGSPRKRASSSRGRKPT